MRRAAICLASLNCPPPRNPPKSSVKPTFTESMGSSRRNVIALTRWKAEGLTAASMDIFSSVDDLVYF